MPVLITGIAGTLGRAFTKILIRAGEIVCGYDTSEWAVAEFTEDFPGVAVYLRDFGDWTFSQRPCETIIHCAAYKHLPLGEKNVGSFIENNIYKTQKLFKEASGNGVDVIFISSDKAVEPISLYGMTKAVGEYIAREHGGFIVRCGNLLGSTGSVIPVWEKAIREKRPIKITDKKMKRFVIDPEDAARQIWDSYRREERLIIPKCKEFSIKDILRMAMAGHKRMPRIIVTGKKHGEKLREKLRWNWEKKNKEEDL